MTALATRPGPPAGPPTQPGTGSTADALAAARRGPRRRRAVVVTALTVLVVGLVLVRALLGDYRVSLLDAIRILGGEPIPGASFVLMESTLPRAVVAVLAGAAFGAAGGALQVLLRNPLASPDVLGLTLGASAAAVVAVVLGGLSGTPVTLAALGGALLVAALVLSQAGGRGGATGRMVLVGVALAAGLSAVIHWVLVRASIYQAQDALVWLSGSLNSVTWTDIARLLVLDAVLLPLLLALAGRLPVLGLGDDLAAGLGVRVGPLRVGVTALVVGLVASATAIVGPVAFVGFLSGPIARRLVPGRPAVGVAALVGAVVVLAADHAAATAIPGTALPVGVVTGLLGAPVLLWMLRSRSTAQEGR
ncbi:FecCD family ABC transporter permease [Oryzobacter sp. R7]|uniref:FecCD family ABC transporter permease n=1 Tax=Oryzobacter faecalis TaxID=3388656 RepID=UPI00398CA4E6